MKITKSQLKQLVKEELNEISSKQRVHDDRISAQKTQRTEKEAEAQELKQLLGYDWDVNVRMLEDRYQLTVNKAYTGEEGF
tara:strand:- start:930 stop:1172 length:243 start_codon:yes stop_codon:yes gene_type:complete